MISHADALTHLERILTAARTAGASDADAVFIGGEAVSVSVLKGEVEDITRSEDAEIGLRVFAGDRNASVALSDFSKDAIAAAAQRAVAMARAATPDEYSALAPADILAGDLSADLDLDDGREFDLPALQRTALETEAAALAVKGISNSGGGGAQSSRAMTALATTNGFAAARTGSSHALFASVIAGAGAEMQRDYAQSVQRHLSDVESAEMVGRRAGERTASRLGPASMKSGRMPVIFDPRVSASLLGHLIGAISGAAIARGTSFLDDPEAQLFAAGIEVIDDPHRPRGQRSRTFDGEGLPARPRKIIDDGRLTGWLVNVASGRQLGLAPTGHAARGVSGPPGTGTSNLHLGPGPVSRDDLIAETGTGVIVTELIGQGVNAVTGDYSRGASGFLIEGGRITRPVSEITIAGNLRGMFAQMTAASDLEFRHATNAPTLRVDGMTVAGG